MRFQNGTINKTGTVEEVVKEITEKGSTFNVQEVIFAIRSIGLKESQINDTDIKNRLNTWAKLPLTEIDKINSNGWYTRIF